MNKLYRVNSVGSWRWISDELCITEDDIQFAQDKALFTRTIQESKRKLRFTKNRFKRDMYQKRLVAAQTLLAALILSRE